MLPIGSIVYLSEGNQKIMVLNRGPLAEQNGEKVFFDYTGSMYPSGLDVDEVYYFNHEDIDQVVFEGFKDDDEKRFVELYKKWVKDNQSKIKRGKTE
ncbi:DUF4176 domain-containing protein [Amphibacillus jilinensis]|uniref:DUF4176 domain-containing protein n=1 Tax=Amphibacillus jilinensis TaxID=1216008 RepID=UPI000314D4BC|nr:DUF4176 domain-containing protein [Amphibacillus jilinensis]